MHRAQDVSGCKAVRTQRIRLTHTLECIALPRKNYNDFISDNQLRESTRTALSAEALTNYRQNRCTIIKSRSTPLVKNDRNTFKTFKGGQNLLDMDKIRPGNVIFYELVVGLEIFHHQKESNSSNDHVEPCINALSRKEENKNLRNSKILQYASRIKKEKKKAKEKENAWRA